MNHEKAKALAFKYGRPWEEMGNYERRDFINAVTCPRCGEEIGELAPDGCRDPECPKQG